MRVVTISAVLALTATAAFADRPAKVPTGYEVPGATNYILVDGRVVEIRDIRDTRNAKRFWDRQLIPGGVDNGNDSHK